VLFILCLDQLGLPLCWVVMLSCSTWVMVVNVNIKDELALPLCYIFACLIQDHMFNRNMENHPGQQCNHKNYMALVLAE
jgi:hypothetical protein